MWLFNLWYEHQSILSFSHVIQARCVWMDGTELVELIQVGEPQTSALGLTFEVADYVNPNANYGELTTVYAGLELLAGRIKDGLVRPVIPEQQKTTTTANYGGLGSYIYTSTPPPVSQVLPNFAELNYYFQT